MKRLTMRQGNHTYFPECFKEPCNGEGCAKDPCPFMDEVCDRLAAYEDTGLTPGEMMKRKTRTDIPKAMISQPMRGRTEQYIAKQRAKAEQTLLETGYTVIDTRHDVDVDALTEAGVRDTALYLLGMSIMDMAYCDAAYFTKDALKARGCRVEYLAAALYEKDIIFEKEEEDG